MLYFGVITAVYPPDDEANLNKNQHEYAVALVGDYGCAIPLNNVILMDHFGHWDDHYEHVLDIGQKVCVLTFKNDLSKAIIIGAIRGTKHTYGKKYGKYLKRRFNQLEETIDKDGNWSIVSDKGENIQLTQKLIQLDNSTGESIVIDKEQKTINIKAGKDWKMQLGGELTIVAEGVVNVQCKEAKIQSNGNTSINASGDVEVTASGSAKINASSISLNGEMGQVLTTMTMPVVDLITGVPSQGLPTVKAG